MCPGPALLAVDTAPLDTAPISASRDLEPARVKDGIRAIVEMIEKHATARAGRSADVSPEEVLVDTEVDGSRYLLVRMPRPQSNRVQLSPREQEIVRMVAKGHPNKVIADVLNISSWTVCTHLRRIFAKLGVGSRAAMVAQLLETRVLTPEFGGAPQMSGLGHRRA